MRKLLILRIFIRRVWQIRIIMFFQKKIRFCGEIEKRVSEMRSEIREFEERNGKQFKKVKDRKKERRGRDRKSVEMCPDFFKISKELL